jgi:hypothetical protein
MRPTYSYAYISATSNTVVKTAPGTLYGVIGNFPAGTLVRVDDSHSFAQGVLNINAVSSNTITTMGSQATDIGIGFNTGLVVAVSSNAKITVVYE